MPKAELLQTAAQVAGQAREFLDAGVRTNLLGSLTEQGHPYGLLFGAGAVSFPSVILLESQSLPGIFILSLLSMVKGASLSSFPEEESRHLALGAKKIWFGHFLNFKAKNVRGNVSGSVDNDDEFMESTGTSVAAALITGLKLSLWPDSVRGMAGLEKQGNQKPFKEKQKKLNSFREIREELMVAATSTFSEGGENINNRPRELTVGKHSVSLGTTAIKLTTYQGEQPFVVKTPQGEPVAQINSGDQLGHLHVSHQAALMRGLSPLQKAEQITSDFIDLFRAVDQTTNVELDAKQQAVLARAQNATLIGISHLVRLFRHRTGLPTWKLDILPDLIQRFHQRDSQAVSKAFGSTRKVKAEDVEMMVVTPLMRQQLAAQNL